MVDVIKFKYNENARWNSTRRVFAGTEVGNALSETLAKGGDIGQALNAKASSAKGRIAKYSMASRDFHGLHFDKQEMKFDNCKLENFNFQNTKFGQASFKNTEIINCSFDNLEFKEKIDFTRVNIDKKSFESLMPAINKYNEKHPNDKMSVSNITVVSNDKKLELSRAVADIKEKISPHISTSSDNRMNVKKPPHNKNLTI